MEDLSTERLPPSSRVPEPGAQAPRREVNQSRRRGREGKPDRETHAEVEGEVELDPHQLDKLA